MRRLQLPAPQLRETFARLRHCGQGRRECQVLWVGPWADPLRVTRVVHPLHDARGDGFELSSAWLTGFWHELAARREGVRAQVHTHPGEAFHSATDDAWPIIHTAGFLSLVIPDFASGPVGFERTYLAEIQPDGRWVEVASAERLEVV